MVLDHSFRDRPKDMNPEVLGKDAFILRPGHFSVIDGDTIWALSNAGGQTGTNKSFSMRFRTIAAPELPTKRLTDVILKKAGIDPHWDSLGRESANQLKTYLDDRALLVQPSGELDRYGRMLCDMAVVPYSNGEPDLSRAISLEHLMLSQKVANPFDNKPPPPLHPQLSDALTPTG